MTISEMIAAGRAPGNSGVPPVVVQAGSGSCGINPSGGPTAAGVQIDPTQVVKSACGYTEFCITNLNPEGNGDGTRWLLLGGQYSVVGQFDFGTKLPVSAGQIANNDPGVLSCDSFYAAPGSPAAGAVRMFNSISSAGISTKVTYRLSAGSSINTLKGKEASQVSIDAFGNFKVDTITYEFDPCDPCFTDGSNVANLSATFVVSPYTMALIPIPGADEGVLTGSKWKIRICWDSVSRNELFNDCGA